jgi:hypothetical protein
MNLKSRYIRIQILIRALYTRFQLISPFADLNKSSVTAIFLALKVTSRRGITYPLIRSSGISLNLLLYLYKPPVANITRLHLK